MILTKIIISTNKINIFIPKDGFRLGTARSIEIVPRGGPPLKMGGPLLEFINILPYLKNSFCDFLFHMSLKQFVFNFYQSGQPTYIFQILNGI
jgi:hypothetical protein